MKLMVMPLSSLNPKNTLDLPLPFVADVVLGQNNNS